MRTFQVALCFLTGLLGHAQEFKVFENGLIYSPPAVAELRDMIAEKDEEFRKCDLNKAFRARYQTTGFFIAVEGADPETYRVPDETVSLQEFLKSLGQETPKREHFVLAENLDYRGKAQTGIYRSLNESTLYLKNKVYQRHRGQRWLGVPGGVLYLDAPFISAELPERYARYLMYSECMIDTTATVFFEEARRSDGFERNMAWEGLERYINRKFGKRAPKFPEEGSEGVYNTYYTKLSKWQQEREQFVADTCSRTSAFKVQLQKALDEARLSGNSNGELEMYVARYISLPQALELKRSRRVVGMCSQDDSPRVHALQIAQLAAESRQWDIFLRSHLDIMNDRMDRMSDGSYAYDARLTYLKELEALQIDVPELMYGISLRTENPSRNHYFGTIWRVGRALSESSIAPQIESELLGMVADPALDDFNRLMLFYLYSNMKYYEDSDKGKEGFKKAEAVALALLPEYMQIWKGI